MPSPLRVVVTRAGERVRPTAKMFDRGPRRRGGRRARGEHVREQARALRERATLVELGDADVDITRLLEWLASERGCRVVLCEGGGVLNADFLAARAIDELYLTIVPRVLGGAERSDDRVAGDGFEPGALPDARLAQRRSRGRRAVPRLRVRLGR